MTHIIWVTNIPTPYRNHRYNVFNEVLPTLGMTFEVAFMAASEPDRNWSFESSELAYPHKFFSGINIRVSNVYAHVNPSLITYVRRQKPDVLVLGGYSAPTLVALGLAPPKGSRLLLAAESNLDSPFRRKKGPAVHIKRSVVRNSAGFVVPGPRSQKYLESIDSGAAQKPVIKLPNIVDENLYRDKVLQLRPDRQRLRAELGINEEDRVWLIPARLHPIKGLSQFLPLFARAPRTRLLLAGDGPERQHLERLCADLAVPATFLGAVNEERMISLYALADVFALPSLQDPSPLSAVEALAAGLPVLLSDRAGNADEVIQGSNGWKYFPERASEMSALIGSIMQLSDEQLKQKGNESVAVLDRNFNSKRCVRAFGQAVQATAKP